MLDLPGLHVASYPEIGNLDITPYYKYHTQHYFEMDGLCIAGSVYAMEREHILTKACLGFTLWFCLAFVPSEQTLLHLFLLI